MDDFVDKALLTQIDRIAKASGKSRQEIVEFILRAWLRSSDGRDTMAIVEGREQIEAGNFHDMDDVIKELEAIVRGDHDGSDDG